MSVRSQVVAVAAVAALAAAAGAAPLNPATAAPPTVRYAAAGWGPVKVLAQHPRGQSVVAGADDVTTVVWATGEPGRRIMALRRGAGGHWGTPVLIGHGVSPVARADGAGNQDQPGEH